MNKLATLALLTALFTGSAQAQFFNGNDLHNDLHGSHTDRAFALGYIGGIADAYDEELFCLPNRAQLGQIRDIVQQFLRNNPKDRHNQAAMLVMVALVEKYPCKKGKL